jgi:uncharacterized phage infection (PIP) family protein YhgE
MDTGVLGSIISLVVSIGVIGVTAGSLKTRVDALEKRAQEDRQDNIRKLTELYASRSDMDKLLVKVTSSLDNISVSFKDFKYEIVTDLNGLGKKIEELRKEVKK